MIRTILAPVTGSTADGPVLSAAATIARSFGAYVHAVHPLFDPAAVAKAAGEAHPEGVIADLVEQLAREADARAAEAKAEVEKVCVRERLALVTGSAPPPSVRWRIVPDEPGQLAACGMTADLIVAPRPGGDDPRSRWTFNSLLFDTGRPVLMPVGVAADEVFKRVAVAWKPTPQAARALAFAMPFLARAAAVTVLTADEGNGQPADLDAVVAYLADHGIKADGQLLPRGKGGAAAAVLRAAEGASLVVMGAYGRSRIGEWMFGGFTRMLVRESPIPVLMAH